MSNSLKILIFVVIAAMAAGVIGLFAIYYSKQEPIDDHLLVASNPDALSSSTLPRFASCAELKDVFTKQMEETRKTTGSFGWEFAGEIGMLELSAPMAAVDGLGMGGGGGDRPFFSATNVQVQGIDEADIVKTDGQYVYTLNRSARTLSIVKAYPVNSAELISQVNLDISPNEMFIHGDYLMIFGSTSQSTPYPDVEVGWEGIAFDEYIPRQRHRSFTTANIWNIAKKNDPYLERAIDFEGSYRTARKIDDQVYFIINNQPNFSILNEPNGNAIDLLPLYRDRNKQQIINQEEIKFWPGTKCGNITYFPDVEPKQFVTVASVSMANANAPVNQEVILGSAQNVYASFNNLYLAERKYDWKARRYDSNYETTVVHKFGLNNGRLNYRGSLEAPGTILNQFSMDEHNNYFRIATTKQQNNRSKSTNNLYIYSPNRQLAGSVENLAPGERIYSTRFMGDRAYMVTFKKIDPLFVIDVSNPKSPRVLGKLKIPGYSDYLHPYDKNHIIGIGKDTEAANEGNFAWFQGLKMALFDVTDVANPKEIHKLVIGDRGTDSTALRDHKAFLFDRSRDLLVLPISLAEIPEEKKTPDRSNTYGEFKFQGSYVYNLTINKGFEYKGRITHYPSEQEYQRYSTRNHNIERNLYIDNSLYSISNSTIKINDLDTLEEQNSVMLIPDLEIDRDRVSKIKQIQTALALYYDDQGGYPVLKNSITLGTDAHGGTLNKCLDETGFSPLPCAGDNIYMADIPGDPGTNAFIYTSSDKAIYSIVFTLEAGLPELSNGKNCTATPNGINCYNSK